jgi:putative hemolysin
VEEKKNNFVDVHRILKEKNPSVYKFTPSFVLSYLKRIVHQDEINEFQEKAQNLFGLDYLDACISKVGARITYSGLENIPAENGVLLASNHPLGGLDGMALMQVVSKKRKDIRFLVNDILIYLRNFGELFVPVNKTGENPRAYISRIDQTFGSDNCVLTFPAGLVSRRKKGVIKDLEWSKSFIASAIKYKKPVVPVLIDGRLSNWFYNLSAFRKFIGVKANIEMMYLADEMFKQRNQKIHIIFGEAIPWEYFDKSKTHKDWADIMRDYIYELNLNPMLTFNEFVTKQGEKG